MRFNHREKDVYKEGEGDLSPALLKYTEDILGNGIDKTFLQEGPVEGNEDVFDFFADKLPRELLAFNLERLKKDKKNLFEGLKEIASLVEKRESTWEIDGDEKYKEEALAAIQELSGARFQTELFLGRGNAGHVFIAPGTDGYCLKYLHSPAFQAASIEGEFLLLGDVNKISKSFKALKVPQAHCLVKNIEGSKNFFTMEKIDGLTLEQVVEFPSKRKDVYPDFDLNTIISLLKSKTTRDLLVEDIKAIHASGVIHGDIHPRNIMLSPKGELVLIDFGNAIVPSSVSVNAEYETIENVKELDVRAFVNSLDKTVKLLEAQLLTE